MGWPWGEMSRCFEDAVSCPPASLSAPLSPEPGSMAQPSCSLDPRGHRPAAISPGAVPLHSSCWEIVKILLDMLSKVCKTQLILDSSFLKCILSIRPVFDFIFGPKTLTSSVSIFLTNKSPSKFAKWPLGVLLNPSQFPVCQGHF